MARLLSWIFFTCFIGITGSGAALGESGGAGVASWCQGEAQNSTQSSSPAHGFLPSHCSRGVPGGGLEPEWPGEEQGKGQGKERLWEGGSIAGLFLENVQEVQGLGWCLCEGEQSSLLIEKEKDLFSYSMPKSPAAPAGP